MNHPPPPNPGRTDQKSWRGPATEIAVAGSGSTWTSRSDNQWPRYDYNELIQNFYLARTNLELIFTRGFLTGRILHRFQMSGSQHE